jgi:hypothetical protein
MCARRRAGGIALPARAGAAWTPFDVRAAAAWPNSAPSCWPRRALLLPVRRRRRDPRTGPGSTVRRTKRPRARGCGKDACAGDRTCGPARSGRAVRLARAHRPARIERHRTAAPRSVGIFWPMNLMEGMPLRPSSLHAALAVRMRYPVCAQDNLDMRCPHGVRFVADVSIDEVETLARSRQRCPPSLPVRPHADTALTARRRAGE